MQAKIPLLRTLPTAQGKREDRDAPGRSPPRAIPASGMRPADAPTASSFRLICVCGGGGEGGGATGLPFLPRELPSGGQCLLQSEPGLAKPLPGLHLALTSAQSCFLPFPLACVDLYHLVPPTPSQLLLQNSACRKGP